MTADKASRKYLAEHAEPEARLAEALLGQDFGDALVIPAHGEGRTLLGVLEALPGSPRGRLLTVVVINARADSPAEMHTANAEAIEALHERFGPGRQLEAGAWQLEQEHGALLLIERCSEGRWLPPRQGVGLARKLGADLALAVQSGGALASPWIHCTDADALLPADYFERSHAWDQSDAAALIYPFRHVQFRDAAVHPPSETALEYEISLRYLLAGLRFAGSPDAHHSIGSTLALRGRTYAQARGFPRRMAAEDFHLLAKLRKLGPIEALAGEPILLSDRPSRRVPFGTGAAIRRARSGEAPVRLYHPSAFEALRSWLSCVALASRDEAPQLRERVLRLGTAETLLPILEAGGHLEAAGRALARTRWAQQRLRRVHESFDALATLKFLHAVRDVGAPSLPAREALRLAPFVDAPANASLEALRERLEAAELQFARRAR